MDVFQNNYTQEIEIEFLIKEFGSDVKMLAYRYVRDWGIAEDISQEVFITCFKKFHTFRGDSSIRTWLLEITRNKSKDELKRNHVPQHKLINRLKYHIREIVPSTEEKYLTLLKNQELSEKIFSLPVKYREIIILFYYKELKIREIHELTGLNLQTIKTRLSRSRSLLRKMY